MINWQQGNSPIMHTTLILVGGTGSGKTHIATAIGTALIQDGKKVRFFDCVDLINLLIKEDKEGKTGRIQKQLMNADCVVMDELGLYSVSQIRWNHAVSSHWKTL